MDNVLKYWPIFTGIAVSIFTIVVSMIKINTYVTKKFDNVGNKIDTLETKHDSTSEIFTIKLTNIEKQVLKTNGRLNNAEKWQADHIERHHIG